MIFLAPNTGGYLQKIRGSVKQRSFTADYDSAERGSMW
jgi:hypothetical protein